MKKKAFISCIWVLSAHAVAFAVACALAVLVTACGGGTTMGETKYTVTFDSMGGPTVPSQSVVSGGTIKEPSLIAREGFNFNNEWYRVSGEPYGNRWIFDEDPVFDPDTVNDDLTLYARWYPEEISVTISFYYNEAAYPGGTPNDTVEQEVGDYLDLNEHNPPAGTKLGYRFIHWYNATDAGKIGVSGIQVMEGYYHFIAVWEEAVTITFNTNGGSAVPSITPAKGATFYLEDITTRKGADMFDGWYLDTDFEEPAPDEMVVNEDITLYAKWYSVADQQILFGVWKNPDGKTYLLNSNLTAWYFDDTTYTIQGMNWRPMTINSEPFTLNEQKDTLTLDGVDYTKATVPMTPEGVEGLSVRWIVLGTIFMEFILETDGSGTLSYKDLTSYPWFVGFLELGYTADDDNVYLLDKDGYVLLTIKYIITVEPDNLGEKDTRWLDGFLMEQELQEVPKDRHIAPGGIPE
jgi:uncharacterized repeat protein (TIGR02543 family)